MTTTTLRRLNHEINVERYRLTSDTDTQAVQRAINMAVAAGSNVKKLILPVDYTHTAPLDVSGLYGVTLEAAGPNAQKHQASVGMQSMFITTGGCGDLTFRGFNFQGTGVDDTNGIPRRSRTWGSTGFGTAMTLYGDLRPRAKLTSLAPTGSTSIALDLNPGTGSLRLDGEAVTVTSVSGGSGAYTANLSAPTTSDHPIGGYVTVTYSVRNIRLEQSRIQNVIWAPTPGGAPSLPVLFGGIRGEVEYYDMHLENTYDSGFVFNEFVKVNNYVSINSADNGISVSRGNQRATLTNLNVTGACYWGVWVSGFNQDIGPNKFLVNGVNIKNVGYGGIQADSASKRGTIVNYDIEGGYFRGPSDAPTDSWGCGIYVGGYPSGSTTPTDYAEDIHIGVGRIARMPRAGIIFQAVKDVSVIGAKIRDIGTQYLADGTTAIANTDANNNVGVLVLNSTTSFGVTVAANDISDWRATPFMNYQIRPGTGLPTANDFNYFGNSGKAGRNTFDIVDYTSAGAGSRSFISTTSFTVNSKFSGGATAGSNAGGSLTTGFDVNGAAGNVRPFRILTASSERWRLYGDTTAESGSNAGTNLVLESKTDAGAALNTLLTILRTGSMTLGVQGQPLTVRNRLISGAASSTIAPGANASAATAAGNGANDTAGTLNATVVASGATAGGALIVVTFATPYSATPHVVLTPQGSQSASCQPYISARSTTGFTISSVNAPVASASLQYDYAVVG